MTDEYKMDNEREIELHNLRLVSIDYPEEAKAPKINPDGTIDMEMTFDYTAFNNGHLVPTNVEIADHGIPKLRGVLDFAWPIDNLDGQWAIPPLPDFVDPLSQKPRKWNWEAHVIDPIIKEKIAALGLDVDLFTDGRTPHVDPYADTCSITITWPEVKDAVGYAVYTMKDMLRMAHERQELKRLCKLLNRRKKQARARTGRR